MYDYERPLWQREQCVTGTDEVGRGPLAGPVVCAAVVLDPEVTIEGLADSKTLSQGKREMLDGLIRQHARAVSVVFINAREIDRINILQATREGMKRAVESLPLDVDHVLVDALTLDIDTPQTSLIKGDQRSASIAAASIVAKVARDNHMLAMAARYPAYGFDRHKGYPTKAHLAALDQHGVSPLHRRTFGPVAKRLKPHLSLEVTSDEN